MAHKFTFTIDITVERTEGKFASREDIAEAFREELESNLPEELYGLGADGESSYEVTDFRIDDVPNK